MDPDGADWSPWNAIADTEDEAVALACKDWHAWALEADKEGGDVDGVGAEEDEDDTCSSASSEPEIIKVYQGSWIGVRV